VKTMFKTIQITPWRVGASIFHMIKNYEKWWRGLDVTTKCTTTNHWSCWGLLWMFIEIS
jgi:hypothetical protein